MRALLLSAYDATSHARWHRGLANTFDDVDWTTLTLPPRHFRWRRRGNALWWALQEPSIREPYDVVVATSMVDLAALLGLAPSLSDARIVVYFHENQFEYPTRDGELDMQLGILDIYSALAADAIVFNSTFNRRTMLAGVEEMLRRLPDFTPANTATTIASRSTVIPVGLEPVWFTGERPDDGPLRIVWNHRWEYDKAPERFFAALQELQARDVDFRVDVVGQQFREAPPIFEAARESLVDRIDQWGFVEDVREYRRILNSADVVVSTALHEFQGLAVLEAVASGCIAAAPNRLAYPEFLPEWCLYDSYVDDPEREAHELAGYLGRVADRLSEIRSATPIDLSDLLWSALRERYRAALTP